MTQNNSLESALPPAKWRQCNGQQLRKLLQAGLIWLDQNHIQVNALNVFPVPDGDTGTNMLLTMRSAFARIERNQEMAVGKVAHDLAHGALMGARGNSGVILSQIWRGLAQGLKDKETANVHDMAKALKQAADTAYKGVMRPVEGTILTVIREGSDEAVDAAEKSSDLRFLLERMLERSQQALERTPQLLPVLAQAGVVDSGGQGLVFILEGMLRYVNGQMNGLTATPAGAQATATAGANLPAQALAVPEDGQLENPYDVQFILMGQNLDVATVRDTIDAMGDSTVVVGDEHTIKVHVHVKDPGQPISYGISLGHITDVVVENMQMQMEDIVTHGGVAAPAGNIQFANLVPESPTIQPGQVAVVAVTAGPGLADIFRSLGTAGIVSGGQTNNPSTEEILQAIGDIPTDKIIVLPNNKNIILAAEAACHLSTKHVVVVPTRTAPQGVAAMLAWNPDGDLEQVSQAMDAASSSVCTGEITVATRTVTLNDVQVETGQLIGIADGQLCASGRDIPTVLAATLASMGIEEREILSVYYGQQVTEAEANDTVAQIAALYPDLEIELLPGGQPHYFYILGAE